MLLGAALFWKMYSLLGRQITSYFAQGQTVWWQFRRDCYQSEVCHHFGSALIWAISLKYMRPPCQNNYRVMPFPPISLTNDEIHL